jgi:hypothetical protein
MNPSSDIVMWVNTLLIMASSACRLDLGRAVGAPP